METLRRLAAPILALALTVGLGVPAYGQDEGGVEGGAEGLDEGAGGDAEGGGEVPAEGDAPPAAAAGGGGAPLRRSDRMDFDDRLIKGQSARSGAIYLFKRTPRDLPELVTLRTTYRSRIVDPVLGREAADRYAKAAVKEGRRSAPPPPEKRADEPTKSAPAAEGPLATAASGTEPAKVEQTDGEPEDAVEEAPAKVKRRARRRRRRRRPRRRRR